MAGIRQQGDFQHTIERQTTYGTPVDTTALRGLVSGNLTITQEADVHDTPHDRGLRFMDEADTFADTEASIVTAELDTTITPTVLENIVNGLFQKSTDWADTASVWDVYPVPSVATYPLLRSNEGYFWTLTKRSPTASLSERVTDAIVKRIVLSIHPKNGNTPGCLSAKVEFIGTTYSNTANPSAAVTHDDLSVVYKWGGLVACTYNGDSILSDFISAEIDITLGAKFMGDVPNGAPHFPKCEVKCTIVASQNAYTQTAKTSIRSRAVDTAIPFVLDWSAAGTMADAGDLKITVFGVPTEFSDTDRTEGETHTVTLMGVGGTLSGGAESPIRIQYYS